MATKKRCPKGVSKTTGKCLKRKRPRKKSARKATKRRGNCKKFGRSPTTGKCRKSAPTGGAKRAQAALMRYGAVFG